MAKKQKRRIEAGGFTQLDSRHKLDILLQAPELFHFDIGSYMSSLESATAIDMYNRCKLYDMYNSAFLTDPHLIGVTRKRLVGACRTPIEFVRNNKPDDTINALLRQPWFRNFRKDVVSSELWGFTLLQFWTDEEGHISYDLINRKHFDPIKGVILRYQQDVEGIDLEEYDNTIVIGDNPRGLGLMSAIMPYILYKRGNMGDWAQFCQIFGMPIREYTYDAGDEEARRRLLQDARKQGANAVYIHPKDSALNIIESGNKTGSSDLYKNFNEECDTQISIAMLGNTLTTDAKSTGTQALGTVHQQEEDEIKEDDEALILSVLNSSKMMEILTNLGMNVQGGEFRFVDSKNVDKTVQLQVVTQLSEKLGLPIGDDYLYETFDITKPEDYDAIKAIQEQKAAERKEREDKMLQQLQGGKNGKQSPQDGEPSNQFGEFWDKVRDFFVQAPGTGADDCQF